jgi:hypothetical protein
MAGIHDEKIDVGRTIGRGLQTIGAQLPAYLGLSILLAGIPTFATSYSPAGDGNILDPLLAFETLSLGAVLLSFVTTTLLQATIVRSAILTSSGRPADVPGSLVGALAICLPLIGLSILTSIIIGIGFVLLIVPGCIALCALSVAVPAMVEERLGIIGSMERSAALTKGSRGRIFLMLILLMLAYFLFAAVVAAVGVIAGEGAGTGNAAIAAGFEAISASLSSLVVSAMVASLYVELRTVKEGATAEGLASIFE